MVLSGWREYAREWSHPGWYREFTSGGEDHDPRYIKFNGRQQWNRSKRALKSW